MGTFTHLLSSRTEYSTCNCCCPIENLEQCDEGQDGRNERGNLYRMVSTPIRAVAYNMIGRTGVAVEKITPLITED